MSAAIPAVPAFLEARRSIRAFTEQPVGPDDARRAGRGGVHRARTAPLAAVALRRDRHRRRQARTRRRAWASGGAPTSLPTASPADGSTSWSRRRTASSSDAPAVVLGCLTWDGLDRYPDDARQRAEWGMALLSLGAAVENLMLAAADRGLASCWVAAPIFCPEAAATRSSFPTSGCPTRWCSSATPTRATRAGPARRSRSTSSAPTGRTPDRRSARCGFSRGGRGTSRGCGARPRRVS